MISRTSVIFIMLCSGFLFAGCSDDGDLLPCPEGGLTTAEQLVNAADYGCNQPQICPDQGSMAMPTGGYIIAPTAAPYSSNNVITNCSTGQGRLEITKIIVRGDARCAFTEPQIEKTDVDPGTATAVKIDWKPEAAGEDHAALVIFSNAQNFPVLVLPACSTAYIEAPVAATDAGVSGPLVCNEVTTVNTTCHSE
ncbi:MAG: hypothetical protein JRH20_02215 [Deltaproteobacteria bacterium]|nr:hypothetical protein [Deltaproteobacteria bacterium]